jgi:hypothetical protein
MKVEKQWDAVFRKNTTSFVRLFANFSSKALAVNLAFRKRTGFEFGSWWNFESLSLLTSKIRFGY